MTEPDDDFLDRRVASLPRAIDPAADLWQRIHVRIDPPRARLRTGLIQAAAAAALFASGWFLGQQHDERWRQPSAIVADPLAAAAEVQRAGTAYVGSLAELRRDGAGAREDVLLQARDAALAAVQGAAWELLQITDDATAAAIFDLAAKDRRAR